MKTSRFILTIAAIFSAVTSIQAQDTFQNLNFEAANVPVVPQNQYGGIVNISDALPGWTGYLGENQITQVAHNGISLGSASIAILGPDYYPSDIIQGRYTVSLKAGAYQSSLVSTSIGQNGIVPSTAQSVLFKLAPYADGFVVSFASQSLSPVLLATASNYKLWGANISDFSGQTGELRFTALPLESYAFNGFTIDAIQFSNVAVPEPSTFALTGMGGLILTLHCGRKTSRK